MNTLFLIVKFIENHPFCSTGNNNPWFESLLHPYINNFSENYNLNLMVLYLISDHYKTNCHLRPICGDDKQMPHITKCGNPNSEHRLINTHCRLELQPSSECHMLRAVDMGCGLAVGHARLTQAISVWYHLCILNCRLKVDDTEEVLNMFNEFYIRW